MNPIETDQIDIVLSSEELDPIYRILDIGGGGEGIISQLYKSQVVAIDIREEELVEINEDHSLKIVMDATKLSFIDNQFDKVTMFFSLMYMNDEQVKKTIAEATRVLKPKGKIEIWDIEMPSINEVVEDIFIVQLKVYLNNSFITTGYGVKMKPEKRKFEFYKEVLLKNPLEILEWSMGSSGQFYISLEKLKEK